MAFLMLVIWGFCSMWQNADAVTLGKPVLNASSAATLGSLVEFYCYLEKGSANLSVTYRLLQKERNAAIEYTALSGEPATFTIVVLKKHDGNYMCEVSGHNNSEITPSYSGWHHFAVLVNVEGAQIISSPSSVDLWEGDTLMLQCNITQGTYVSYDWLLNGNSVRRSYDRFQNQLNIQHLTIHDSGNYTCVASNQFNGTQLSSSTAGRTVHIKAHLSKLDISFGINKDENGSLRAKVICKSSRGTPPARFTLLKNNNSIEEKVSEDLHASFIVPIVIDQDMGTVQCQADNGRQVESQRLNLTVESVGGAVTMTVEKAVNQDFEVYGLWLHCRVERGTFPYYHWFLNNSELGGNETFCKVFKEDNSGLTVSLSLSSAGIYHCEATNSFDNTTRVCSAKMLISKEVLNKLPLEVTVAVFTCFSLVVLAVLACCIYGVVLRKKQSGKYVYSVKEDWTKLHDVFNEAGDAENEENKYEDDDLETEVYAEDMDVLQASGFEEPDTSEEEEEIDAYNGTETE